MDTRSIILSQPSVTVPEYSKPVSELEQFQIIYTKIKGIQKIISPNFEQIIQTLYKFAGLFLQYSQEFSWDVKSLDRELSSTLCFRILDLRKSIKKGGTDKKSIAKKLTLINEVHEQYQLILERIRIEKISHIDEYNWFIRALRIRTISLATVIQNTTIELIPQLLELKEHYLKFPHIEEKIIELKNDLAKIQIFIGVPQGINDKVDLTNSIDSMVDENSIIIDISTANKIKDINEALLKELELQKQIVLNQQKKIEVLESKVRYLSNSLNHKNIIIEDLHQQISNLEETVANSRSQRRGPGPDSSVSQQGFFHHSQPFVANSTTEYNSVSSPTSADDKKEPVDPRSVFAM
jgi:hypothetical protein